MNKFKSIAELRSERNRLYNKKELLEDEIKLDFEELKDSIKPLNMIKDLFTPDKKAPDGQSMSPVLLSLGSTILDLLISRGILHKASYLKKLLSSYLIHATGPSVIQKYGPSVVNIIKSLYNKFKHKSNSQPIYEQSTANGWYEL